MASIKNGALAILWKKVVLIESEDILLSGRAGRIRLIPEKSASGWGR